jgi:hypothetical protein
MGWFVLGWAVAFAGVWVASRWWFIDIRWHGSRVTFAIGMQYVDTYPASTPQSLEYSTRSNTMSVPWMWWFWERHNFISAGKPFFGVTFPGWFIPGVLAGVGGPLLRSGIIARRARIGFCKKCRYDLRGLPPGSPCPECGTSA